MPQKLNAAFWRWFGDSVEHFVRTGLERLPSGAFKYLFHGTNRGNVKDILRDGLKPQCGEVTAHSYGTDDCPKLTFFCDIASMAACLTILDSVTESVEDGAIIVVKNGRHIYQLHEDGLAANAFGREMLDVPRTVEPGDYFTSIQTKAHAVITGENLKSLYKHDWFHVYLQTRHESNAMMKNPPDRARKEAIMAEFWRAVKERNATAARDCAYALSNLTRGGARGYWRNHYLDLDRIVKRLQSHGGETLRD